MAPSTIEQFGKDLEAAPVIAICRGVTPDTIIEVCEALVAGGVRFVETTLNSPDPIASIGKAAERFKDDGRVHIGAGTVLSADQVDQVADAGGAYIISPNFNREVVRRTKERGLISIPGFFTSSEAFSAVEAGADFLKCFPARALGPGYIKDLKAVLPHPIMAVGGVNLDNARDYLAVAVGLGIGSALFSPKKTPDQIKEDATEYMRRLRE
ncbi:MAG: 2-dehydro-3-deoxy-6-phosphogalactonate aldolase [Planctomycetota bacterium]|nr:2-dehydro-3-deoxy-6-phosphogalactonate aldolase [Planctomycetota bacterium]